MQNFNWTESGKSLEEMVSGTAHKPYVYRALVPQTILVFAKLFHIEKTTSARVIMYASLVGFIFSFRYLYRTFWKPTLLLEVISILAIIGILVFAPENKLYDLTGLSLFTLGLATLARTNLTAYLILFPLAVINKETALLLVLVFALHFFRTMERKRYAVLLIMQVLIFGLVRLALNFIFTNNPGTAFEIHWREFWLAIRYTSGLTFILMLAFLMVFLLISNRFQEKPIFLQHAAIAVLPAQFILYWTVGFPFELRFFLESYPIVLLFMVQPLSRMLRLKAITVDQKRI